MGLELANNSLLRIVHQEEVSYSPVATVILAASILVKFSMYFYNQNLSVRIDSGVARDPLPWTPWATCLHHCCSAMSRSYVSSKGLAAWSGWCGLAVSIFILRTGFRTIWRLQVPWSAKRRIRTWSPGSPDRVLHTKGILDMHDLLIHDY